MSELRRFMRANPQVVALLVVCLVLGIGTFLLVIFGLVASGSDTTNGEPSSWRVPAPRVVPGTPAVGSADGTAVAAVRLVAPLRSPPPTGA